MSVTAIVKPLVSAIVRGISGGDGGANPLVFHALTHAGASGGVDAAGNTLLPYEGTDTLVATVAGMTEGRTTTNLAPDHEGVWRSWGSGEAVREGWRVVENLLTYSEDFSNAAWTKRGVQVTSGQSDPNGGESAFKITENNTNSNPALYLASQPLLGSGTTNGIFSVWLKADTGTPTLAISADSVGGQSTVTLSTSWQRFSIADATSPNGQVHIGGFSSITQGSGLVFYAYGAQLEAADGRTNTTNCSEYVPTTSSAAKKYFASTNPWEVTSNVATPTATVTELTDIWTKGEPAHTNSLPYSKPDTTNWTETGTAVIGADAVGLTGVSSGAQSAVVLTDDDGSVAEYIQVSATTTAAQTDVLRVWVKKDTDETRFPAFQHFNAAGANLHLRFNTKTGVTNEKTNSGTNDYEVRDAGDWWEILLEVTTADTSSAVAIYPAFGTSISADSTAATGSVTIADPVELHLNTTIAAVRGSSPIFTSGAAASTVATSLSFDDANHDDTQGGWYAEFQKFTASGSSLFGYEGIVGTSASQIGGQLVFRDSAPYNYLMSDDGTNRATSDGGITAETTKKVACAYGDNLRANNDGSWGAETSYDGGFGTVGSIKVAAVGMITGPILIRNIKRWNADYTTAQSLIDSEML